MSSFYCPWFFRNNDPLTAFFSAGEQNVEPYPTFDLEINKEDKDKDIDNPVVKEDSPLDKPEAEENEKKD